MRRCYKSRRVAKAALNASPLLVAAGLVWRPDNVVLVQRRSPTSTHGANRWELPGGKLHAREDPRDALERELCEEWGPVAATLTVGPVAEVLHHMYPPPGPEVMLLVFHVDASSLGPAGAPLDALGLRPEPGVRLGAFERAALPVDEFLAADRPFLRAVAAGRYCPG